jgi:hypothetical protein
MTAYEKIKIAQLKGSENYEVWSQEVMLLLLRKNAWKCTKDDYKLSKTTEETFDAYKTRTADIFREDPKLEEMDSKAKGLIIENIHPNYRELVMELDSSYDIWYTLKKIYGSMTNAKLAIVFKEFYNKKIEKEESIEAHCDYLEKRRNLLKGTYFEVKEEAMAMVILGHLRIESC